MEVVLSGRSWAQPKRLLVLYIVLSARKKVNSGTLGVGQCQASNYIAYVHFVRIIFDKRSRASRLMLVEFVVYYKRVNIDSYIIITIVIKTVVHKKSECACIFSGIVREKCD